MLSINLQAQHQHSSSCTHGPVLPDVRQFPQAVSDLMIKQEKLEKSIYSSLQQAADLVSKDQRNTARNVIENMLPQITAYKKNAADMNDLLFSGSSNIENTLRIVVAVPQQLFDDSGLSWDDFTSPIYYTYETVINTMFDAHPELEQYCIELVHIELVPDGSYLTNCVDAEILFEIRTEGPQNYPEIDIINDVKECWQAHLLSFIVPFSCDANKGLAVQNTLSNMSFITGYSTVRYDLIESESTVPAHEACGHNLTLVHDDYEFDPGLNQVSVMFEDFNPMFAGEFYSAVSVAKLQNAIPLMLTLASPTDLDISSDTSTLESCTGTNVLIEAMSNNGTLSGNSSDPELSFTTTSSGLEVNATSAGTFTFTVIAANDAYCYTVESEPLTITFIECNTNTPPTAQCQPNYQLSLNENGNWSVTADELNDGSFDLDGDALTTMISGVSNGDCEDIGELELTLVVTDTENASDQCNTTISLVDDRAPLLSTQDLTVEVAEGSTTTITIEDLVTSVTDNCSALTPSAVMADRSLTFQDTEKGQDIPVELSVSDDSDNVSTEIVTVTVTGTTTTVDNTASPIQLINPVQDELQLLNVTAESIDQIDIYDLSGKLLLSAQHTTKVRVSALPAGLYVLRLRMGEGMFLRRFVRGE